MNRLTIIPAIPVLLALCMQSAIAAPTQEQVDKAFQTLREATLAAQQAADEAARLKAEAEAEKKAAAKAVAEKASATVVPFSVEDAVPLLQEAGYKSVQALKNETILFSLDGAKYLLKTFPQGDIQLYYGLAGVKLTAEDINDWNSSNRLSRAYLDSVGDAILEADLPGSLKAGKEAVRIFIDNFVSMKVPAYIAFVRERNEKHKSTSASVSNRLK